MFVSNLLGSQVWVCVVARLALPLTALRLSLHSNPPHCPALVCFPCSTDNCARTVRTEEKAAQVANAVRLGRRLLLRLEQVGG